MGPVRRGSGVYVRANKPEIASTPALALDQMIARLFLSLESWVSRCRRSIAAAVIGSSCSLLITSCCSNRTRNCAEFSQLKSRAPSLFLSNPAPWRTCPKSPQGGMPVVLPNREAKAREMLAPGTEMLILQIRSVPASLSGYLPAPFGALVGVASRWQEFLKVARAVLTAAGFSPDSLVLRDAREPDWHRGLKQTIAVVCDVLTASELPAGCRAIPFSLLSEASIAELKRFEEFVRNPLENSDS